MSIRWRLLLAFGLLVVSMIGITGFSLIQMSKIKTKLDSIVDVSSRRATLAEKLKTQVLTVTVLEKNIILSDSGFEAESLIRQSELEGLRVREQINELQRLMAEQENQLLSTINTSWDKFLEVTQHVHTLATTQSFEKARGLSEGEALASFDKTMEEILSVIEANNAGMQGHKNEPRQLESLLSERALLMSIENALFSMQTAEQNLLHSKSNELIRQYVDQLQKHEALIKDYFSKLKEQQTRSTALSTQAERYRWLKNAYKEYLIKNQEIRRLMLLNPKQKAHEILNTEGEQHLLEVNKLLDTIIFKNENYIAQDQTNSTKAYNNTRNLLLITLILALIVCISVSYFLAQSITSPLRKLGAATEALASGDISRQVSIHGNHEVGTLAKAFNKMAAMIHQRVELQTRLNTLATEMRGDQDPHELSTRIISSIARMLKASVGAIYLADDNTLDLYAAFAADQNTLPNTEHFGNGFLGQVAADKQALIIDFHNTAHSEQALSGGIVGIETQQQHFYPLLKNNQELVGVLTIGFTLPPDTDLSPFFKPANESIAIALSASLARRSQIKLLQETQKQAAQLNLHQSKLSQINDELEQQKQALEQSKLMLERKAEELDKASRYKSEFLANMSHELRSPLNSLLLLSKTLSKNKQGNLQEDQINSLKYIHSGGQELLSHINDILDLSKIEAGKLDFYFEPTSTLEICDDLLRTYTPQAKEKGIKFYLDVEEGIPTYIRSDKKRIIQILRNLVSNAMKFTHTGSITLALHPLENIESLSNSELKLGAPIAYSVIDTGIGIAREQYEAIFEAFQQADGSTSRKYGGTGLGLAISREFSKKLGGEIQVQSEPGQGSRFTLILPSDKTSHDTGNARQDLTRKQRVDATAEESIIGACLHSADMRDDRQSIAEGDRILLAIEDDPAFAKILFEYSQAKNFKCIIAKNGEEGIDLAKRYKPTVITLDIGLPDIDGKAVLKQLKTTPETATIPVHVISSYDTLPDLKKDTLEYLTKPVTDEELDALFQFLDSSARGYTHSNTHSNTHSSAHGKSDRETAQTETSAEPTTNVHLEGLCALVVDDDIRNMFALSQILLSHKMRVIKADNGELALEKFHQHREEINIVLMDIMMPVMDGYEAIRQIRLSETAPKHTPIIALTAKAMAGDRDKCLQAGADDYLTKPLDESKLLDQIQHWLGRQI